MQQIRVCTHDGPAAKPVMRTLPRPKLSNKGALIKISACRGCGIELQTLKAIGRSRCPGHSLSLTSSAAASSNTDQSSAKTS